MSGAVVIGAGPGIGRSVAIRFAREGMPVAVVARRTETVTATAAAVRAAGGQVAPLTADSADDAALRAALDEAATRFGPADVVVYNAAQIRADVAGELSTIALTATWAVNVAGAVTAAAHVAPGMAARGGGSFLVTGGMPDPDPNYLSLSLGKSGIRTLVVLLDRQFGPAGVHVATVTVTGSVAPGTAFDPDDIAEHYVRLHRQPRSHWEREVVHAG